MLNEQPRRQMLPPDLPGAESGVSKEQDLRDRVRRHHVRWQARPEYHVCGAVRRQIGFRVGLLATQDRPGARSIAECPECWQVYTSLRDLARWVVSQQEGQGDLQIEILDASLSSAGERRDVSLAIQITHRHAFERPMDADDLRCLAEIEAKLLGLGALRDS
jgi:hypothetical protein